MRALATWRLTTFGIDQGRYNALIAPSIFTLAGMGEGWKGQG
jgi:hypothetical protein